MDSALAKEMDGMRLPDKSALGGTRLCIAILEINHGMKSQLIPFNCDGRAMGGFGREKVSLPRHCAVCAL